MWKTYIRHGLGGSIQFTFLRKRYTRKVVTLPVTLGLSGKCIPVKFILYHIDICERGKILNTHYEYNTSFGAKLVNVR